MLSIPKPRINDIGFSVLHDPKDAIAKYMSSLMTFLKLLSLHLQHYLRSWLTRSPSKNLDVRKDIQTATTKIKGNSRGFTARNQEIPPMETCTGIKGCAYLGNRGGVLAARFASRGLCEFPDFDLGL